MRALLRRFRRELRERGDIRAGDRVVLGDGPSRAGAARVVRVLLEDALNGRVEVAFGPDGLLCGCREELSARRLMEYTRGAVPVEPPLGSSLTRAEMQTYFKQRTGETIEVTVPASPESRLLEGLADGPHAAGRHTLRWTTSALPSGVYVFRLNTPEAAHTRRVAVV